MAKNPQIPVEIKLQYEKAVRDFQRTVSEKLANITVGLTVPQNNIQAAIKAIQKGITTTSAELPIAPADFEVVGYDLEYSQLQELSGDAKATWTPQNNDLSYRVERVYNNLVGNVATGNMTGEVYAENLAYNEWRNSTYRLIPYSTAYPEGSIESNEAIASATLNAYRLGYRGYADHAKSTADGAKYCGKSTTSTANGNYKIYRCT